jgi:hypothetical protein
LAQLHHTSYTKLPVVFENVRIHQHLEIPERGMYVHCKYYEGAIKNWKAPWIWRSYILIVGSVDHYYVIYRMLPKSVSVLIVSNC